MTNLMNKFRKDEDGAVTVDWVVLTAAIVALGLVVGTAVRDGATDLANDVGADLIPVSSEHGRAPLLELGTLLLIRATGPLRGRRFGRR